MQPLTTATLANACRIFMELAYPGGAETIPASKRPYCSIAEDRPVTDYLSPAPAALGICRDLAKQKGGLPGWEFRLGSAAHPHLKLRIQILDFHHQDIWVYSVDTHDGCHHVIGALEAEAWRTLVEQNRFLKHQIEHALADANFLTPKNLLQLDLATPTQP